MPHLDLGGGFRLHHERYGDGPPVVFAHGAGGNGMSWWRQVPAFAERHTVVTFDHRAFGRSPDVEDGPGRAAFGEDALALLDALGLGAVHFVAHSMGARTAIGLMRLDPARFRSLTVSGSNAGCVDDRLRARKAELQASGALAGTLLQRAVAEDFKQREPALWHLYRQIRALNPPRPRDFLAPSPALRNFRGSTAPRLLESGVPPPLDRRRPRPRRPRRARPHVPRADAGLPPRRGGGRGPLGPTSSAPPRGTRRCSRSSTKLEALPPLGSPLGGPAGEG